MHVFLKIRHSSSLPPPPSPLIHLVLKEPRGLLQTFTVSVFLPSPFLLAKILFPQINTGEQERLGRSIVLWEL